MALDLYERLRQLKEGAVPAAGNTVEKSDAGTRFSAVPVSLPPEGWESVAPFVFRRTVSLAPEDAAGAESLDSSVLLGNVLHSPVWEDIGFYDTETTGLSGGAGSHIFLFGVGFRSSGRFVIEQVLLGDYPAEPEFLKCVDSLLARFKLIVSYNGRAFDSHLLATRFLMNRLPFDKPGEVDLLYPARSMFRRVIGACSLSDIERDVLGVERQLDVPGALIPGLYFEYLRTGNSGALVPVFAHHAEDIFSLYRLLMRMEALLSGPAPDQEIDPYGTARLLARHGKEDSAVALLEHGAADELPGNAARYLASLYRRRGMHDRCAEVWSRQYHTHHSVRAGIELAKIYEHRLKDHRRALTLVSELIELAHSTPWREDLGRRRERLLRRLERAELSRRGGPDRSRTLH